MMNATRELYYGVDFSGAVDAGRHLWIAHGRRRRATLIIESCDRAADLWSTARRDDCMRRLRELIVKQDQALFGLDFPLGLPAPLVEDSNWRALVLRFASRYRDAEAFRLHCRAISPASELKRVTDVKHRTPLCVYNLRMYRQTYYGLRDVIAPLVQHRLVSVLPMQAPRNDRPWLIEICPASLLKRWRLYRPYKGRSADRARTRRVILDAINRLDEVVLDDAAIVRAAASDPGGDAVDALLALVAAFIAGPVSTQRPRRLPRASRIEGWVYS